MYYNEYGNGYHGGEHDEHTRYDDRGFERRMERPMGDRGFERRMEHQGGTTEHSWPKGRPKCESGCDRRRECSMRNMESERRVRRPMDGSDFDKLMDRPNRDRGSERRPERPMGDRGFDRLMERPEFDRGFERRLDRPVGDRGFEHRGDMAHGMDRHAPDDRGDEPFHAPMHGHGEPPFGGPMPPREPLTGIAALIHECDRTLSFRVGAKRGRELALAVLAADDGMTQRDLQHILGVQPGSISEMLKGIEDAGLIERSRSEFDRRAQLIKLTETGRAEAVRIAQGQASDPFSALTEEEQATLTELLTKLKVDWDKRYPQPPRPERRAQPMPRPMGAGAPRGDITHRGPEHGEPNPMRAHRPNGSERPDNAEHGPRHRGGQSGHMPRPMAHESDDTGVRHPHPFDDERRPHFAGKSDHEVESTDTEPLDDDTIMPDADDETEE